MGLDLGIIIAGIAVVITIIIAVFSENNHKYIETKEQEISDKLKPMIDSELTSYQNTNVESEKREFLNRAITLDRFRVALKDEGETLNHGLLWFGGCVVYLLVLIFLSPYASLNLFLQTNPPLPAAIFGLMAEFILFPLMIAGQEFIVLWKIDKIVRGHTKRNEDLNKLVIKYFSKRRFHI